MPEFDVTIQDKTYHVEIPDPGAAPLQVIVDGQTFDVAIGGVELAAEPAVKLAPPPRPAPEPLSLPQPRAVEVARPAIPPDVEAGGDVTAPMPGTILSLEVTVGQPAQPGQVLCVLEAMKMKNPIRAIHPGTVAEVCVQAGQTVAYGQVLIRLV